MCSTAAIFTVPILARQQKQNAFQGQKLPSLKPTRQHQRKLDNGSNHWRATLYPNVKGHIE